jgi:hypothetical protein
MPKFGDIYEIPEDIKEQVSGYCTHMNGARLAINNLATEYAHNNKKLWALITEHMPETNDNSRSYVVDRDKLVIKDVGPNPDMLREYPGTTGGDEETDQ